MSAESTYGLCHCGCGQRTSVAKDNNVRDGDRKGEPRRFVKGHHRRKPPYPTANGMKICTNCNREKPIDEFAKISGRPAPRCQVCIAENRVRSQFDYHLRKKFGITIEDYYRMSEAQGGVCAICGKPPEENDGRRLHVDHIPGTEPRKIRALLCFDCNTGLGKAHESVEILQKMIDYVNTHNDILNP